MQRIQNLPDPSPVPVSSVSHLQVSEATMAYLNLTGFFLLMMFLCHFLSGLCEYREPLQYSRELLLLLRNSGVGTVDPSAALPAETIRSDPSVGNQSWESRPMGARKRKRGRRGGMRQRLKRQGHH
ncbi:hypothetical protein MATL_G00000030 [Megalops atlanticus]|uniref:Uncharacterized protein n=1 Tax=Megalops atlanticus TaxID=7932 RepID=A0A9D3TCV9_MEGAT|nr:hypothetical protein MATL_G00000030 [Megalops atlanticus]